MSRQLFTRWRAVGGLAVLAVSLAGSVRGAYRTVSDQERGSLMAKAYDINDWSGIGCVFRGSVPTYNAGAYQYFNPIYYTDNDTVRMSHGEYHLVHPSDDHSWSFFPYSKLDNLSTWYHDYKHLPYLFYKANGGANVYWNWSVGFIKDGEKPRSHSDWKRGVNIADDRFIHFYIHEYVYGTIRRNDYTNMWNSGDECAFTYYLFGTVTPDNASGVWQSSGNGLHPWDPPFPQNDDQFLDNVSRMFQQLQHYAPDIQTAPNLGAFRDVNTFTAAIRPANGVVVEDVFMGNAEAASEPIRDKFYYRMKILRSKDNTSYGGVGLLRSHLNPMADNATYQARLRSHYIGYLLNRGDNFFWAPVRPGSVEINPADYAYMKDWLGRPVADVDYGEQTPGKTVGYRLYSRHCQGGWVYLNFSGKSQSIPLPGPGTYYRQAVRTEAIVYPAKLTLANNDGTWIVKDLYGTRAAMPTMSPLRFNRYPKVYTPAGKPLVITMKTTTPGGTAIRYTTDGTDPTNSSPRYSAPFAVSGANVVVKAKTFDAGRGTYVGSCINENKFSTTQTKPRAFFVLPSDRSYEAMLGQYWVLVGLEYPCVDNVTVHWARAGATAVKGKDFRCADSGVINFPPGEVYRRFQVKLFDNSNPKDGDRTIVFRLDGEGTTNAAVDDQRRTFTYTIVNDD